MKKTIAAILLFSLCLSLCSCGVDEKYTALLEHLDAGNYAGMKTELRTLSAEFQAEQEQMAADKALLDTYGDLIGLLEEENYEGAMENILSRMPEPEKPASTEVEITMENWSEYFEVLEYPVADPFGGLYCYVFTLTPRAEYLNRIDYDTPFQMDISHITTYFGEFYYHFDPETNAFTYLDAKYQHNDSFVNIVTVTNQDLRYLVENGCRNAYESFAATLYMSGVLGDVLQKYELQIDNIRGSIFLLD